MTKENLRRKIIHIIDPEAGILVKRITAEKADKILKLIELQEGKADHSLAEEKATNQPCKVCGSINGYHQKWCDTTDVFNGES